MSIGALAIIVLLLLGSALAIGYPADDGGREEPTTGKSVTAWFFGFFAIGDVPSTLAIAVFLSTSAVAMTTLELIANLHFGPAYPPWFPADALASGLGVGLLTTRLLAASFPAE